MSNVLYIKANPKEESQSRTFLIANAFLEAYIQAHPSDQIVTLDLYKENIRFLTSEDLATINGPKQEDARNHPILKYAYQFADADKYVFAAPLWNLGIPAILKAYIDYITVNGISFRYTADGPQGMLQDKKAVNIISRGGNYTTGPAVKMECADYYIRTLLSFIGIKDIQTLAADGLDIQGNDVASIVDSCIKEGVKIAKERF